MVEAPNRLLILACSQVKRPGPGYMPAVDRYMGPLWQTLRTTDPTGTKARVAFVSARYGFCEAGEHILDYDEKLTEEKAAALIAGGVRKHWPVQKKNLHLKLIGQNAWAAMSFLTVNGLHPFDEVCMVGGHLYLDVMRAFVADFQKSHENTFETETPWVTPDARLLEINGPIGIMRQRLRQWLNEPAQYPLQLAA